MKLKSRQRRLLIAILAMVMVLGTISTVFADGSNPSISFTSSGVSFNKETKLLRFNLVWNDPQQDEIEVMYSLDGKDEKKLGEYTNQDDQVIAHIYLEDDEMDCSSLELYAIDEDGNESEKISSEFQLTDASGVTISDSEVPLSVKEGTWSLINLFLTALSVAMVAVSVMLYVENKSIDSFKNAGKVKSIMISLMTVILSASNVAILIFTQDLKHQVVMADNMTVLMLVLTVLSIITTMILAARAFGVQSEKEYVGHR